MSRLDDFRAMIDGSDDKILLSSGQELLREMMEINALKEKLNGLEQGLTEGGKAALYFFAVGLDEDELTFAAERITGKLSRIERVEAKAARKKEKEESLKNPPPPTDSQDTDKDSPAKEPQVE
jgi:hypothetical protein